MASEGGQGKDGDEDMGSASEELQAVLQPYILRRHKTDVMKKVPPKEEVVIEVEFTRLQKKIYRSIYEKNVIKAMFVNVSMELRKCCAHPYLIQGTEEAQLSSQAADPNDMNTVMTYLVQMSGKMVFLEKLLPRLKEDGQKVLIFSQMTRMLDIIQDYLRWRGYMSERLDGNSSSTDRQAAIDRFNTPCDDDPHFDHSPFVFLLSTRAGGVGINLTAASVVVIYDSDWNPQNDTQAQARCHRIGQTKTVKVYRLITRDSYEQHMFDTASRKLGLEQALMSGVTKNSTLHLSKEELNNLIKNGAYAAFSKNEEGDQEKSDQFVSATIDDILSSDRARTVTYGTVVSGGRKSAFSKATFVANEEDLEPESPKMSQPSPSTEDEHGNNVSVEDTDFWRKLVGDDSLAQLMDEEAFDEDMGERRSKFSGSYAIPSLSEMIRQTQGGGGGAHGPTPAQSARQLERQRLGFWFSKSKRRDLHQMFRYGVYGQWEAFRDYLLEDETAHHDNSRKAAVPPSTTETASSTRGVGSSGSVSLATPSPSEESSEEDYEGEDMNSRVDAGEIDEFGMVITDESGEGREDGHAKDGGGETKEAGVDAEISPLRLKGLMIMWIGVLYRTIMTCAYGMVTRRRAAAEAKRAQEEEERQEAMLKESPDDGSPEGGDGSASSSPSPEGGRGLTPSKSPSVEDAPSPTEMDKQPAHHHHHSSNSHFQMLTAEDATGVYTHVKWIYDVELLNVILEEVKADPQLKAMVMGEGESDETMTDDEPADVRKAIVAELDADRSNPDTAKFDELFMWTGMPDVIGHVAETSVTAMWKYNKNRDLQDLVLGAKNAERELNQADALHGLYYQATMDLFNDDDEEEDEREAAGTADGDDWRLGQRARVNLGEGASEDGAAEEYSICRLKRRIEGEGEEGVQWRVEWLGVDRPPETLPESRLEHLPPPRGDVGLPTWVIRAMPRKTTQTTGCRLWWTPRDDKELLRILRVKRGLHTVTTTMMDPDSDNTYFLERIEELRVEQERVAAATGRGKKSKSKDDGKGDSNTIECPNVLFCLGRVRSLWQEWKNQQRALLWTADTDVAKDMVKAFVDTVLSIGVPPAVLDPVLRKTGLRTTFAKFSINNGKEGGNQQQRGANDAKGEEERRSYNERELEAIVRWLESGSMIKQEDSTAHHGGGEDDDSLLLLPPNTRIGAGEPGAMEASEEREPGDHFEGGLIGVGRGKVGLVVAASQAWNGHSFLRVYVILGYTVLEDQDRTLAILKVNLDHCMMRPRQCCLGSLRRMQSIGVAFGMAILEKHLERLNPPSVDHWLLMLRSKCVVTELQDKVKLSDLRRVLTVYLDELKSRLASKGEAATTAVASGSESEPQQQAAHDKHHPSTAAAATAEYITRDMFVNAGFAFVSDDQRKAYQASVNHIRLLQSHNLLRTQLLCTNDKMQQYNMYASLTGSLGDLVPSPDGNYVRSIVNRINTLYQLGGMEEPPSASILEVLLRTLKFGMNTAKERSTVAAILEKLADGLTNKQTYERNQEAKQKRLMAEPTVEAKWCHPARVEASKSFIRWKGVTPWTLDQVLGMLGISGDKRRRLLGESFTSEDKGPALKSAEDEDEEDESDKEMIAKALNEPLTEPDVQWDADTAWGMMEKAAHVKDGAEEAVLASFVPPTANKMWANTFLDDVKVEEPRVQKSRRLGNAQALKELPPLKPQDLLDFGYMYLTHLAYEVMVSEGAAVREETELPNGLIQNQMMHMTFDDLPHELNVKSPLALVTVNGDTPKDEMLLALRQYLCYGGSPGRGPTGKAKKAQQSPENPRDAFEARVKRLVGLAAELPSMRGAASGKILRWWKPEIHDSAILVLFIIYGLPDTWRSKDLLLKDDFPFYQYCKTALCVGGHSQRRRRCNDGRADDPNSLAFKVKMQLTDEVMPALMPRLRDITRLHLFRMYPPPAPPPQRSTKTGSSTATGSAGGKSKKGRGKTRKHPHTAAPSSASSSTVAADATAPTVVPFVADSPGSERSSSRAPPKKRRRSTPAAKQQQQHGSVIPAHGKKGSSTPKKPAFSAWAMFQKVEWAKIKEDFPNMPWDEGSREVARKWKLIAPEEKQQWKDEADRERLKWEATPEGMAIMRGDTPVSTKTTKSTSATKRKRQQPHKGGEASPSSARSAKKRSTTPRSSPGKAAAAAVKESPVQSPDIAEVTEIVESVTSDKNADNS
ncbi:hypothetical protein FOZ60_015845 [Perkinsus olseni]|uniref:Choline dehydrogenase 7 n=3 Tax=Perkinsus olseni TaxID=32597 RepID=A0A7J6P647_PEROL|nr:hypothetical protein FOZ60_015845 [Perkinsus olseni]